MQAIILAAGMGKRLGDLTKNNTKCMVPVGGETLIERLLHQLEQHKIEQVVMVVGYERENLMRYISTLDIHLPIRFVENPIYDKTNNIYSLFLAKDYLVKDDTLLFESDIIIEDSIIGRLLQDERPNLALVDKFESWMDGTVVTLDEENRIQRFIPNDLFRYDEIPTYYKTVNIYKFSQDFSQHRYVPFLEAYCTALGRNEYYEQVLRVITMLDNSGLQALPLNGEYWYEIDDVQDLDIANSMFSPDRYDALCSRYGGYWRYPHLLDFCYLVNPYFPNARLQDELKANFNALLTQYPSGRRIINLLASKDFHLKENYVLIGNGAAELIDLLAAQTLGKVGIIRPTFEEYPNRFLPEQVVAYTAQAPDFRYSVQQIENYFEGKNIWSLVLINPDNPSGNYLPYEEVLELIEWCEQRDIVLILDESFIDFAEQPVSFLNNELLEKNKHLVVVKSISKSYGVPGLRLGLLATANGSLMTNLRRAVPIWNTNAYAEFFLQILGKYEKAYQKALGEFRKERARFVQALQTVPYLRVLPSQANYVLCEVSGGHSSREVAVRLLQEYDILIKDAHQKCNGNFIRLAIRNEQDNNRLLAALQAL